MSTDLAIWLATTALSVVAVAGIYALTGAIRDAWAKTRADHLQRVIADAHCDYTPNNRPDEWTRVADTWGTPPPLPQPAKEMHR